MEYTNYYKVKSIKSIMPEEGINFKVHRNPLMIEYDERGRVPVNEAWMWVLMKTHIAKELEEIEADDRKTTRTHHLFDFTTGYSECDKCKYNFGNHYSEAITQVTCPGCDREIAAELSDYV